MRGARDSVTGAKNPAAKKVVCLNTGDIFGCIKDATLWLKETGKGGNVKQCLSGITKTAGGFKWDYFK